MINQNERDKWGLSSFVLKIVAVVCMTLDHTGEMFFRSGNYYFEVSGNFRIFYPTSIMTIILNGLGRIAFPLFAFLLVEGLVHTSNRLKYMLRLGVFAFLSEIPYDLFTYNRLVEFRGQNIFFTLFIALGMLCIVDMANHYEFNYTKWLVEKIGIGKLTLIVEFVTVAVAFAAAYYVKSSYKYAGVFLVLAFYAFRDKPVLNVLGNACFNIGLYLNYILQWAGLLSAIPIALYNGKPGKKGLKYFFYVYYPLHLMVLYLLRMYVIKPY